MEKATLWDRAAQTPAQYLQPSQDDKGQTHYKISPLYPIKKATELFGPIGLKWGYRIVSSEVFEGHTLPVSHPSQTCSSKFVRVSMELWYTQGRTRVDGIMNYGHASLIYVGTDGRIYTNTYAHQQAVANGLKRLLSYIGIGADVRLNEHEPEEPQTEPHGTQSDQPGHTDEVPPESLDKLIDQLKTAISEFELETLHKHIIRNIALPPTAKAGIARAYEKRKQELNHD